MDEAATASRWACTAGRAPKVRGRIDTGTAPWAHPTDSAGTARDGIGMTRAADSARRVDGGRVGVGALRFQLMSTRIGTSSGLGEA